MRTRHRHTCAPDHQAAQKLSVFDDGHAASIGLGQFGVVGLDRRGDHQQVALVGHALAGLLQGHVDPAVAQGGHRGAVGQVGARAHRTSLLRQPRQPGHAAAADTHKVQPPACQIDRRRLNP